MIMKNYVFYDEKRSSVIGDIFAQFLIVGNHEKGAFQKFISIDIALL